MDTALRGSFWDNFCSFPEQAWEYLTDRCPSGVSHCHNTAHRSADDIDWVQRGAGVTDVKLLVQSKVEVAEVSEEDRLDYLNFLFQEMNCCANEKEESA